MILMQNLILEFIYLLEQMLMVCGICCVPIKRDKKFLVFGGILFAGLCMLDIWIGYDNMLVLTYRVYVPPVIVMLWTKGKIFRRLIIYICSMMYLHLPYLCIDFLFSGILKVPVTVLRENANYKIVRGLLTCLILVIFLYKSKKILGYEEIIRSLPSKYFFIGCICSFSASYIEHYFEDIICMVYGKAVRMFFVTGCMVVMNGMFYTLGIGVAVLDLLRRRYKEESNLKDQYLQITKEYAQTVKDNARETRKMRHDLQAHIGSMRYYMDQQEYQKAKDYLLSIGEHMAQTVRKTMSVNHEIVDAVLLEQQVRAEHLQIVWRVEGLLPADWEIADFDLCTLFSNLLANSVEACEKVPLERRFIHLEIRILGNNLVIELENPTESKKRIENLGSVTSKKDVHNHGYGISNIKMVVERNFGEIYFSHTDDVFTVRVLFQLRN